MPNNRFNSFRYSTVHWSVVTLAAGFLLAMFAGALTGCVQEPTVGSVVTHSEPSAPLKVAPVKKPPRTNIALPSNVVALAYGISPPPPFSPPPTGGTLYIWDNDDKQVAWMTSYAPWQGEKPPAPVNIDADVPEAKESLIAGHHYTVYYAPPLPGSATTTPATRAAP